MLVRDTARGDWHWEPRWSDFSFSAGSVDGWRHGPRLSVRADAHYSIFSRLALIPGGYETFAGKLAGSDLSRAVTDLFAHRGIEPPEVRWQQGIGDKRQRHCRWVIAAHRKDPAVLAMVSLGLSRFKGYTMVNASAALWVEDITAWREFSLLPFSLDEVADFLTAA